ncbi:GNAT family N-acetyltransferase [Sedimentitalea todarodis]|uniref:GNAT family N-acetyltransferase n=1 Tax=Sedimentitalea todarodis TaxID=1631240 RepID=A0ABU3VEE3_9RHOB|nr:GNAT family N-acetyltransferase [Sedimentitalea todarodis]MDU9004453.1 GNAT family N-acetyltransferase [Sedimentitalea todarodis]
MIDLSDPEDTGIVPNVQYPSLRRMCPSDASAITEALWDPELARWLAAFSLPGDPVDYQRYLDFLCDPDVFARVVCVDGNPVGVISLGTELSFWIKRAFHQRGLGLWAVRSFLDQLPDDTGVVNACCMFENKTAAAFLTRLGFRRTTERFRRFSFAHGHAVEFLRFQLCVSGQDQFRKVGPNPRPRDL